MFWSKARKINELQRLLNGVGKDLKRAALITKGLCKEKNTRIEELVEEAKGYRANMDALRIKLNESNRKVDTLELRVKAREVSLDEATGEKVVANAKAIRYEKELKQVRNAYVSYAKDLLNLNVKMQTQKNKLEGML